MTTKRVVPAFIVGVLGIVSLIAAALLPTLIRDNAIQLPTDLNRTTRLVGNGTLIDRASFTAPTVVTTLNDVPVQIIAETSTAPTGDDRTARVTSTLRSSRIDVPEPEGLLSKDSQNFDADRKSFETLADPTPTFISAPSTTPAPDPAAVGTLFSFAPNTGKQDYQLFEPRGHAPITMKYIDDTREINGVETYHFRGEVVGVDLSEKLGVSMQTQVTMPALKWGLPGGMEPVTMTLFYSNFREMWVEPTSGTTVDSRNTPRTYFARTADDELKIDAFSAELGFDQATVDSLTETAQSSRNTIRLVFFWLPISLAVFGLLCVVAAAVLFRGRRSTLPGNGDSVAQQSLQVESQT